MPALSYWLTSPFLPAVALVAGAAMTWLARRFLPSHWPMVSLIHRALPVVSALAAVLAIWSLRQLVSPSRFLLILPPTLGLDLSLRVQLDEWGRLFGLSLLWPALTVAGLGLFGSSSDAGDAADPPAWSQWLSLLAAAHLTLAAADWLTLAAALVLFDLVYLATAAPQSERGRSFLANGSPRHLCFPPAITAWPWAGVSHCRPRWRCSSPWRLSSVWLPIPFISGYPIPKKSRCQLGVGQCGFRRRWSGYIW